MFLAQGGWATPIVKLYGQAMYPEYEGLWIFNIYVFLRIK